MSRAGTYIRERERSSLRSAYGRLTPSLRSVHYVHIVVFRAGTYYKLISIHNMGRRETYLRFKQDTFTFFNEAN